MERQNYEEMTDNLNSIDEELDLSDRKIILFAHCNATLELVDLLEKKGLSPAAILDNNPDKQGIEYKGVKVIYPEQLKEVLENGTGEADSVVLITSRFYSSMQKQLRLLGYTGPIRKLIDYNTYADYSLLEDTIERMTSRERHGEALLEELVKEYPGYFKMFCPFNAIGDIYFMISYYPAFARRRGIEKVVFCVVRQTLADVIHMFDENYCVKVYEQKELDAMIQAALYTGDKSSFIAHQDRPYVINLSKALYIKKIPLEQIYCCGVYGLPKDTEAAKPSGVMPGYAKIEDIPQGRSIVFSPYAKSVPAIGHEIWRDAVNFYNSRGYKCYTNVVDDELPLEGTDAISPSLMEMRSVVERAGTFVGIRSGLCDILREAKAKKIALYPDYNYSDTKWKAIDMYYIEQFDYNIVAVDKIDWGKING
jgi:hypothetical protein